MTEHKFKIGLLVEFYPKKTRCCTRDVPDH
jgi:hypothetical protein